MSNTNPPLLPQPSIDDTVATYITAPRLAPYLAACDGNRKRAIHLYQWNIALSGAVYEALHVFEIVLRNALDAELCRWNATQTNRSTGLRHDQDWLLDPAHLLLRLTRGGQDIESAKSRARTAVRHRKGQPMIHADVLAQMSLGTWRFLLPDKDPGRQRLWADALTNAFPHRSRPEHELVAAVAGIYKLRNRVAHLEPLLRTANIRVQYRNMRDVLAEIDPVIDEWFTSTQRITAVLRTRP